MRISNRSNRRSIRECIKSIISRRDDDDSFHDIEISKQTYTHNDLALIPSSSSSLASLPNFASSQYAIENYSVSTIIPVNSFTNEQLFRDSQISLVSAIESQDHFFTEDDEVSHYIQASIVQLARQCAKQYDLSKLTERLPRTEQFMMAAGELGPASSCASPNTTSSVHTIKRGSFHFQSPLSQLVHACSVPSVYRCGKSQQASLTTLKSPSLSSSTLRLQRSTISLERNRRDCSTSPKASRSASITSKCYIEDVDMNHTHNVSDPVPNIEPIQLPVRNEPEQNENQRKLEAGIASIDHFVSFCVLDAATKGCPVTATSEDLEGVIEIGEDFCLDTSDLDGAGMDTVTGKDKYGIHVVHLVIYNPLINPNTGRNRFVLAALLDITTFVTGAAFLPDLKSVSTESEIEEDIKTPPRTCMTSKGSHHSLTIASLLDHNCLPYTPELTKEDIWLDIASEETRRTRSVGSADDSQSEICASVLSTESVMATDILDQFISQLQNLYSDFFLLGKSPQDETSYEICNISPRIHEANDYIEGHISHTPHEERQLLEEKLSGFEPFCTNIRWGSTGARKRLYGVPLHGRSNTTWLCLLISEEDCVGLPSWN